MKPDWWPQLLADIGQEQSWAEGHVPVASLRSIESSSHRPGERRSITVLVPAADLQAVSSAPGGLAHEVLASGPNPVPEAAPNYDPKFWVSAQHLPRDRYEPFILSWTSHDQTVLMPDPRFLMTYGLVPRSIGSGKTVYDDAAGPTFDIVEVDPPSIWTSPVRTTAEVRVVRDYVQDYLTLCGMALFESFYAIAWGDEDADALHALGGKDVVEHRFPDRTFQLNRIVADGRAQIVAQVWGARLLATPADLPITANPLEQFGLPWPGFDLPITPAAATRLTMIDYVYVDDAVLGSYEGVPGFEVHPESGAVRFGGQWSVGDCDRVGRDKIRLELKKLYEGAPHAVIQHWQRHAVVPTPALTRPEAQTERNIAARARELVLPFAAIGARLHDLAEAIGVPGTNSEAFVGLSEADLAYHGWWKPEIVEPVTRYAPLSLDRDGFLRRCGALNNLLVESLGQPSLRAILTTLGVPAKEMEGFRGLKLLDLLVRLAQVARATGYRLPSQAEAVREELKAAGTNPERPLENLFALYDLRIIASHKMGDVPRVLEERLARFGVEPGEYGSGFGRVLDRIYDVLGRELESIRSTLTEAVSTRIG